MLRPTLFILTTLTALAIGASGPATAAKHKSSSSSDAQSKAEAEIAITKKLLESGEDKGGTTTTQRRRQPTPATVVGPTPPNIGATPTTPDNSSSASTTGAPAVPPTPAHIDTRQPTAATIPPTPPNVGATPSTSSGNLLGTIQQYFAQHDIPAPASATLPEGTQLNAGAQVPRGVSLFPLPYDLMFQMHTAKYAYFVSGNNVVVVDADSNTVAGVFPTHR
jgi:hypothetical protein